MSCAAKRHEQLTLLQVKEEKGKKVPEKRVNIVSVKLVKEKVYCTNTVQYAVRNVVMNY